MRILCLHDSNSSGPLLLDQLNTFAKKLYYNHGIELAFVNAPLILTNSNTSSNDNNNEPTRTWFHDDTNENQSHPRQRSNHASLVGLDASVLSLHQIWKQTLHSASLGPFCGIIGFGQGAALGALLPLLQIENHLKEDTEDGEKENCGEGGGDGGGCGGCGGCGG